jgi:hypothetical protein
VDGRGKRPSGAVAFSAFRNASFSRERNAGRISSLPVGLALFAAASALIKARQLVVPTTRRALRLLACRRPVLQPGAQPVDPLHNVTVSSWMLPLLVADS